MSVIKSQGMHRSASVYMLHASMKKLVFFQIIIIIIKVCLIYTFKTHVKREINIFFYN